MEDSLNSELESSLLEVVKYEKLLCEKHLNFFITSAWEVLESEKLEWNFHHSLIAEYLELAFERKIRRLIINLPPRSLKSLITSVFFPVWCWIKHPYTKFLFGSYSESLAVKHSKDRRDIIESDWFRYHWRKIRLAHDQNLKTEFMNTYRGHMIATSMLGTATGKGGDFIIIDDPHNPRGVESPRVREATIEAFNRSFMTRLNNQHKGVIIIVMQRLHTEDLTGYLLKTSKGWTHVSVEAIAEEEKVIKFPKSGREILRKKSSLLHEERESAASFDEKKKTIGTYAFSAQYQQRPTLREGNIIKRSWWKFYKVMPQDFDEIIQSWDSSFKDSPSSDYVCGQVWGRIKNNKYLLDQVHARMDFPSTLVAIKSMSAKWTSARTKIIEESANGHAIISILKKEITGIIPYSPRTSKIARLNAVSPEIEAGNIYLPDPELASWIADYLFEFDMFPQGAHDDMVDATTQALLRFQEEEEEESSRITNISDIISLGGLNEWNS